MVRCIVIGLVLGTATEALARWLSLWRYHHARTPIINVIGMFGLVMGGLGSLVPRIGVVPAAAAGLVAGLAYELLNLHVLHWWYFPNERMGFVAGHTAILGVLALLWGMAPVIVATANVAFPHGTGRPTLESRLERLNLREQRLVRKLEQAHQQVRDLETRLEAVRAAKQALTGPRAVHPSSPRRTRGGGAQDE